MELSKINLKNINRLILVRNILTSMCAFNFILLMIHPFLMEKFDFLQDVEFPKGQSYNTSIVENGNIIIGNDNYSRIQIYNKNGEFINGWFVEINSGSYIMAVEKKTGLIHLLFGRSDDYLQYNQKGDLISHTNLDEDNHNSMYKAITNRKINKNKIRAARRKVKSPLYWYPFMFFPTVFIYAFIGGLIQLYIKFKSKELSIFFD